MIHSPCWQSYRVQQQAFRRFSKSKAGCAMLQQMTALSQICACPCPREGYAHQLAGGVNMHSKGCEQQPAQGAACGCSETMLGSPHLQQQHCRLTSAHRRLRG